jgi:hypothetical protein
MKRRRIKFVSIRINFWNLKNSIKKINTYDRKRKISLKKKFIRFKNCPNRIRRPGSSSKILN